MDPTPSPDSPVVVPQAVPQDAVSATSTTNVRARRLPGVHEVVIVDAECSRYGDVVAAAQDGLIGVHFCVDGRSAVRLSRQFRADLWVIASELPDMSGVDLIELLARHVHQADVDPLRSGASISLGQLDRVQRPAIFLIGDSYRPDDELRALSHGVSGYLVRPVSLETLLNARSRRTCS